MGNTNVLQENDFVYLNPYVTSAYRDPILLAGYWGDFPFLQKLLTFESAIQISLSFIFIVTQCLVLHKYRFLKSPQWTIIYTDSTLPGGHVLIAPLLVALWQLTLGGMQLGLAWTWMSAPATSMVYLHSQVELYLTLFRAWILCGDNLPEEQVGPNRIQNKKLKISLLTFAFYSVSTLLVFMTTSNPRLQGFLAGTAFLTDFALLLLTPVFCWKSCNKLKPLRNPAALMSEIFFTTLGLTHILQYYIPIIMVSVVGDPSSSLIQMAGTWLMVASWLNLAVFVTYFILNSLAIRTFISTDNSKLMDKASSISLVPLTVPNSPTPSTSPSPTPYSSPSSSVIVISNPSEGDLS